MSLIHPEVLDNKRKDYFQRLKIFRNRGYLAGGTALSLQIKHRYSFDFDIFLDREIKRKEFILLKKYFLIKKVQVNSSEQLTIITSNNIDITLVFYPYKNLFPLIKTESIPLLSVKDIALDKAYTIGRRGTWRDYVDIFFLLKDKYISIAEIIRGGEEKFKEEFNPKLFLEQLVYFEDLGEFKASFIGKKYSEEMIKKYLVEETKKYQKTLLKKKK